MTSPRRLGVVIAANAALRVSGGAGNVLVGLYLADLANAGAALTVAIVGVLSALSFGAELVAAVPMGVLSDAVPPRLLMAAGALLAGVAAWLFGLTEDVRVFIVSRVLEGLAAAVTIPALLSHLADATADRPARRATVMSLFELSLLSGLALGGLAGSWLWASVGPRAFFALAGAYAVCAVVFLASGTGSRSHGREAAIRGFRQSLRDPALRRLTPIWLCVNAIIGLWLGPTFLFLLTRESTDGQFLAGLLAETPDDVGLVLLGYSLVFGAGLVAWSVVLPRVKILNAMRTSLAAMLIASAGLYLLNHSTDASAGARWALVAVLSLIVMVESGFTPAALALLAGSVAARAGRGAAMGIYSMLLSLGALVGSVLAGWLGEYLGVDGLIVGTLALALMALGLVGQLDRPAATPAAERAR